MLEQWPMNNNRHTRKQNMFDFKCKNQNMFTPTCKITVYICILYHLKGISDR